MKEKRFLSWRHILLVNMPLALLSFLIEKNILAKFMNNAVRSPIPDHEGRDFNEYFIWSNTPEGWKFWHRIYLEYGCHYLPKYYQNR